MVRVPQTGRDRFDPLDPRVRVLGPEIDRHIQRLIDEALRGLRTVEDSVESLTTTVNVQTTVHSVEVVMPDATTGALNFRWGIDAYDRPVFDPTGGVVEDDAARLLLGSDARFYVEDLPL